MDTTFRASPVDKAISALPLKKMDATLLHRAIIIEAVKNDMDVAAFESALAFASWAHREQMRAQRGPMPKVHYVEHPYRVCLRVFRYGVVDQPTHIAAILHDTVEDAALEIATVIRGVEPRGPIHARALSLLTIAENFSEEVAAVVDGLSNPIAQPNTPVVESNSIYVEHILTATTPSPEISEITAARTAVVKLSDFADNPGSLKYMVGVGNDVRVVRLATKYRPAVPVLESRLEMRGVQALIPAPGIKLIRTQLATIDRSLRELCTL
jgi:(p)ppGpp synthase/HD superfamily hydrolase